jgi:hypothetical protein
MTMIAFTVRPDGASIITDTLSYLQNGRSLGTVGKVHPMPHLDAVVITQGGSEFGRLWKFYVDRNELAFDDLGPVAAEVLPLLWADHEDQYGATVFHVGYSPQAGRFKAYAHSSKRGFVPEDVTDEMVAMPLPLSDPPGHRPESEADWTDLAVQIRRERALAPIGLKVFVGGDVFLTSLERGSITQRKIHTFDDSGDEFRLMVAGTAHPLGQLGDCTCGSGQMMALCHQYKPNEPCACMSGQPFRACCSVTPEQILAERAARREAAAAAGR